MEHAVIEGVGHLLEISAEATGIAGLVLHMDGSHDGQVPEDYGPATTLPETTIEGTPTTEVHNQPDAPPEAPEPAGPPEANESVAPAETNQSVAPPEANQSVAPPKTN